MEDYKSFRKFCDEKVVELNLSEENIKKYKKEIIIAKRFYDNGRNLYQELMERPLPNTQYVLPYLLGKTSEITDEPFDYVQVKPGASGGIDVDSDFAPGAKEKVFEYLKNKFGEERVLSVGTFTRLGPPSAAKDILRIYKVDFKLSNEFTKCLDTNETWEQNIERIKNENSKMYQFYLDNKEILDMTPYFINKIRQVGKHAGGVVILDRPVYDLVPVERVGGELATAFPESAQHQVLDEIGVIKFDILGISILDVIASTVDMIDEKLYLIEDDDGMIKAVPQSYVDTHIKQF